MLETYEWQRDNMQLPQTWLSHNCWCMPHFHAGIELVYVSKGVLKGMINGKPVELSENQMLIKMPVVRNGKKTTVGYCPEVWKTWE